MKKRPQGEWVVTAEDNDGVHRKCIEFVVLFVLMKKAVIIQTLSLLPLLIFRNFVRTAVQIWEVRKNDYRNT